MQQDNLYPEERNQVNSLQIPYPFYKQFSILTILKNLQTIFHFNDLEERV